MRAACTYKSKFATHFALVYTPVGDSGLFVSLVRLFLKLNQRLKTCGDFCWKRGRLRTSRAHFILINTRALEFICKTALMPLVKSSLLCLSFKSRGIYSFQHRLLAERYSLKSSGVRRGQGVKSLFQYYIFSTLLPVFWENGRVGACSALQPSYLFTFSLQDYIGIIIVFYGTFFWCLALFKGPVDLGRWRKMDPFWGIRLLWKKMQLHTGPLFSFPLFCFPPGANLSGCSILELEWHWSKWFQHTKGHKERIFLHN